MSLKGKAAAIGIGELKPLKEPGDLTALGLMARAPPSRGNGRTQKRSTASTGPVVGLLQYACAATISMSSACR